jgi:hypothetical protein
MQRTVLPQDSRRSRQTLPTSQPQSTVVPNWRTLEARAGSWDICRFWWNRRESARPYAFDIKFPHGRRYNKTHKNRRIGFSAINKKTYYGIENVNITGHESAEISVKSRIATQYLPVYMFCRFHILLTSNLYKRIHSIYFLYASHDAENYE